MQKGQYDYLVKILLVGDSGVGKTTLLMRYCDNVYSPTYICTIGIDFKYKAIAINDKMVKAIFWDTTGQERYRSLNSAHYKGAHGAIIVFDLTNKNSFTSIDGWRLELAKKASENIKSVIIGCKADQEKQRVVSYEEACSYASEHGLKYFEVSSLNNTNILEAIHFLVNDICSMLYVPKPTMQSTELILIKNSITNIKDKCC